MPSSYTEPPMSARPVPRLPPRHARPARIVRVRAWLAVALLAASVRLAPRPAAR